MTTQKEKAIELIKRFMPHMYCYMGSSMLSNEYDAGVALNNAKECVKILVGELQSAIDEIDWMEVQNMDRSHAWWYEVVDQLDTITIEDIS